MQRVLGIVGGFPNLLTGSRLEFDGETRGRYRPGYAVTRFP